MAGVNYELKTVIALGIQRGSWLKIGSLAKALLER